MNSKQVIAAAALALLGSSAFAGGEFDPARDFQQPVSKSAPVQVAARAKQADQFAGDARSVATRAQVATELAQARSDGSLVSFDTGTQYAQAPKGATLSRDAVRNDVVNARIGR